MWVWPLWMSSVFWNTIRNYETTVAWSNKSEADAVQKAAEARVQSMKWAWDVVESSAWEEYTRQWHTVSVNQKVWSILNIKV